MADVHPLIFEPILKPKIWGGRRLESALSKRLPPRERVGESWELADLENDQSVVACGPAKGRTLGELVRDWGADLLGRAQLFEGRFPLLIKFLDANDTLSVQVHPDEAMARRLGGNVRVKNEAWYIVDAEPTGFIYRGVKPGVTPETLRAAIADGSVEQLMHRITVRKGQCYYLPSGTLHALGAGVLVAEVQTPSDITYRVYDFNRVDPSTGRPRDLHIEQALECICYDEPPHEPEHKAHVASVWTAVTRLVQCSSFVIERVRMVAGVEQMIPYEEMVIWMVLEGSGVVKYPAGPDLEFRSGDTVLLPAALKDARVATHDRAMWLEVSVPIPSSLAGYDRPDRASLRLQAPGSGLVTLNLPPRDQ